MGEFFAVEVFFHKLIVGGGDGFVYLFDVFLKGGKIAGDLNRFSVFVGYAVAGKQVDVCHDLMILHQGHDNGADGVAETVDKRLESIVEVGFVGIHFGNEEELCRALFFCNGIGLFISYRDPRFTRNDYDAGTRRAEALSHFTGKVKHTGSVDYIKLAILPFHRGDRRRDGGGSFLFLGVKIHNGISVGHLAESVGCAAYVKHGFAQRSFSLSAMAGDGNIFYSVCRILFHFEHPFKLLLKTKIAIITRNYYAVCSLYHGINIYARVFLFIYAFFYT